MRLLTVKEVADVLRVTPARVYEMGRLRVLPAVRLGRTVRFDEAELQKFIVGGGRPGNKGEETGEGSCKN